PTLGSLFNGGQTDAPPGMGNWDNSCYQNSVVQGLASLKPLQVFLTSALSSYGGLLEESTNSTLHETIQKLNDPENNGRMLWMPAKLKSMSSWQQQDAQEYFSKILDEVDKELLKVSKCRSDLPGFNGENGLPQDQNDARAAGHLHNPLEGFLAQRVACTQCGYSEGLSMIPFNCLTVPLGREWAYDIRDCLDEYTKLEAIEGVECAKCTLLRTVSQLEAMLERLSTTPAMNEPLRQSISARLQATKDALESEDFTDKTLSNTCQISKKNWMSTTKSRQAVIARAPKSLVIHVNRSVFNEMTGAQMKNYADVSFPSNFDLGPWCLGRPTEEPGDQQKNNRESWSTDPKQSMLPSSDSEQIPVSLPYELRAVVTHFGRHENGHYICYRKHPSKVVGQAAEKELEPRERWWRLSDEDVSPASEGDVLQQGGVFMLFYEQV
ncbi:cysteine proteinase, partial [Rhizodiscina lignyota]